MNMKHVAFIMDGNRRFAKENNLSLEKGYEKGMEQVIFILKEQIKKNIKHTSFFALSSDNLNKRGSKDLKPLGKLIEFFSKNEKIATFFKENQIAVHIRGNLEELKKKENLFFFSKKNKYQELEEKYKKHNQELSKIKFHCNIALNYDGQLEILEATKKLIKKNITNPTLEDLKNELYFNDVPAPEVIVRTGNAPRISGFLLFDSAYSEIYLTKTLWPQLNKEEMNKMYSWYENIKRNFGS